ncbi:MAG: aminoacyl-tRNA hydrolase [Planctomycetota bacterium]|nr:MAG: aminoacyl-tRNA hydrolase [Planctomycetota bacterium]
MLTVNSRIRIPESELETTFARSSGPGGQNVNKVNSKAMLRWRARTSEALPDDVRERFLARYRSRITTDGDIIVSSQRYRDQARNVDDARKKLCAMLASVAVPPKKRKPTKPSRAAKQRRLESKQAQARKKQLRRPVRDD